MSDWCPKCGEHMKDIYCETCADIGKDELITEYQRKLQQLTAENEALQARVESLQENELTVDDVKMIINALGFLGCSTPESLEEACASSRLLVRKLSRMAQSLAHVKAEAVHNGIQEVDRLRKDLEEAGDRIRDMYQQDDGQAWKEVERFMTKMENRYGPQFHLES